MLHLFWTASDILLQLAVQSQGAFQIPLADFGTAVHSSSLLCCHLWHSLGPWLLFPRNLARPHPVGPVCFSKTLFHLSHWSFSVELNLYPLFALSSPRPQLLSEVNGTPATATFQACIPKVTRLPTSIFSATWLPDKRFLDVAVLPGASLPLLPPPLSKSFSEYDNHLKTNYLLANLISVSQQGATGSHWVWKCCCLVNEWVSLGSGTHTGTAAAPGFLFTLISYLQLALET